MTARKPKTKAIEPSHEAEHEQDVVGQAEPAKRWDAIGVAKTLADAYGSGAAAAGNQVHIPVVGPDGLVQTFVATVVEGIREF